jgi:heptosyltransferase II
MKYEFFEAPQGKIIEYKRVALAASDWRNGIIVRSPNWLGDIVMALPAMYSLKKLLPKNCGFFVATPSAYTPLFESIDWVDSIVSLGTGHSKWTKEQVKELKQLGAGIGFLFVNSLKSAYYLKRAGIKKLFGASNGIRNLLLSKHYKVEWRTKEKYDSTHQSYKYLAMTNALGAPEWDGKFPNFNLLKDFEIVVPEIRELRKHKNILAIHPGAAYGPAKRWSPENFKEVCNYWIRNKNGKVAVLGLNNEADTANKVIKGLPENSVINLVGKTTLSELMYVLKNVFLCLCNDSGTMHLASALNVNGIAIFGSTDPYSTGPFAEKWIVMLKKQVCAPCFSRECKNSMRDYKCLKSVTPEDVYKAIDVLLKKSSS